MDFRDHEAAASYVMYKDKVPMTIKANTILVSKAIRACISRNNPGGVAAWVALGDGREEGHGKVERGGGSVSVVMIL